MDGAGDGRSDEERRRDGRRYLVGLGVSVLGSNALSLAAGIWVKALTGSSGRAAIVSVCVYAPSLAGPAAGLLADRVRRRHLLIGLNLVSAAAVLPLLAVDGRDRVWIIFAVMAGYGIHLAVAAPAEDGLFAVMLPLELRRRLNGWNLGLQEAGRLIAPLAGAGLFAVAGGGAVALIDSASFVVAAAMTARVRFREPPPAPRQERWRVQLTAGFAHVGRTPPLRLLLPAASLVMGVSAVLVAAQYSLVQGLGEPPAFLGVLTGALGAGSIVASLASGPLLRRLGEIRLAVVGMVDLAVGYALRATGALVPALAGSVILGFALPWVLLALLGLTQRCTPPHLQGRVAAAVTLVFFGPQAPLQLVGAALVQPVGYRWLYLAGAVTAVATAAGMWTTSCEFR